MATIDLKLKTYEQLQFEVNRLVVDNFLKQQELDRYKNNWEELKKWVNSYIENEEYCYLSDNPRDLGRKDVFEEVLNKMKELEEAKDEK